ncbi:MAG: tetraacyldisaccharide 4'-kinase [Marinilabiliaceae bacterium]|nr:tetraacyldisaccharide 4'-kinase [Marinilabiliaceae bacterium]
MRVLLLPFSWIFAVIIGLRNFFFDRGILKSEVFSLPIISVGNITLGGTGKTPLSEYIIRTFSGSLRCGFLSRGYGRLTKGALLADSNSTFVEIGDEPKQLKSKFENLLVVVSEKRRIGMQKLLNLPHPPDLVVLDDAYQHRYVKPGISILVMDYFRPIWKDFLLPAGNLREPQKNIKRADIIVVNKCPVDLSEKEADFIKNKLNLSKNQQLFFTSISYKEPISFLHLMQNNSLTSEPSQKDFQKIIKEKKSPIIAVAGIGNPTPFFEMVKDYEKKVKTFRFKDHHRYTIFDINKIIFNTKCDNCNETPLIITTEKDAFRMIAIRELDANLASKIWYIPIELIFLYNNKLIFDKILNNYVRKN